MKRTLLTALCAFSIFSICLADETAIINSFNSGELSPRTYARTDVKRYYSGCKTLENMFVWPHGPVTKRPGLYYVASAAGETVATTTTYDANGYYPVLQDLDAGDIPAKPSAPTVSLTAAVTEVNDVNGLQAMSGSGKYYLANDVNMAGESWTPITGFTGVFDGNNFTISNLDLSASGSDNQALFGTVGDGAEFYDVTFTDCNVTGRYNVGILIGDVNANGHITANNIQFTDCNAYGTDSVAIFAGSMSADVSFDINDVNIADCNLTSTNDNCGPLIGYANVVHGDIRNCAAYTSTITARFTDGGGLIGSIMMDSSATADVNIVDCNATGTLSTESGDYVGGFAGRFQGRYATYKIHCHTCSTSVTVDVNDTYHIGAGTGGFVGRTDWLCHFVSCSATGGITVDNVYDSAAQAIGGFTGLSGFGDTFTDCYATGDITFDATGCTLLTNIGGFIGKNDWDSTGTITRCYATGDINITMPASCVWSGIGGFAGSCQGNYLKSGSTIERCWAFGDVTLSDEGDPDTANKGGLGGFIGAIWHIGTNTSDFYHTVENCYSWSSITISAMDDNYDTAVSGFLGAVENSGYGTTVLLTNVYAAQTDTAAGSGYVDQIPAGETYSGGIVGYVKSPMVVTDANTYWDNQTSNVSDPGTYAVEKSTAWLQNRSNFQGVGWDFTDIWYIPDDATTTTVTLTTPVYTGEAYRLLPFEYSTEQAYVLAFSDKTMNVYRDVP